MYLQVELQYLKNLNTEDIKYPQKWNICWENVSALTEDLQEFKYLPKIKYIHKMKPIKELK
jgi:hypothetical protein